MRWRFAERWTKSRIREKRQNMSSPVSSPAKAAAEEVAEVRAAAADAEGCGRGGIASRDGRSLFAAPTAETTGAVLTPRACTELAASWIFCAWTSCFTAAATVAAAAAAAKPLRCGRRGLAETLISTRSAASETIPVSRNHDLRTSRSRTIASYCWIVRSFSATCSRSARSSGLSLAAAAATAAAVADLLLPDADAAKRSERAYAPTSSGESVIISIPSELSAESHHSSVKSSRMWEKPLTSAEAPMTASFADDNAAAEKAAAAG